MPPENDHETLVQRATSGDDVAVADLVVRHQRAIEAAVRRHGALLLRGVDSVSDVVQSVCREALIQGERIEYRGEAQFAAWLQTVVLSKLVQRQRRFHAGKRDIDRETRATVGEVYATLCTPSQVAESNEQLDVIAAAFDRLSDDYKEIITQACILEMSHREIAAISGRSEEACRQLLTRARARLGLILGMQRGGRSQSES